MPRYFFNVLNGKSMMIDCSGQELDDDAASHQEARLIARDFVHRPTGSLVPEWSQWSIQVRDTRGRLIFGATFQEAARTLEEEMSDRPSNGLAAMEPSVVHLDSVRVCRRFSAVESEARDLLRRTAMLMDRQRYAKNDLHYEIERVRATVGESRRVLMRSAVQSASPTAGWKLS